MFDVGGGLADAPAVAITLVQRRDLCDPAVHETPCAAADEHDRVVRQPTRLDVVVDTERELPQTAAVRLDLVEVKDTRAALAVAEEDRFAVVMDSGIAKCPGRILEEYGALPGGQTESAERTTGGVGFLARIPRVVAQVRIPVAVTDLAVSAMGALREDDFPDPELIGQVATQPVAVTPACSRHAALAGRLDGKRHPRRGEKEQNGYRTHRSHAIHDGITARSGTRRS